MGGGFFSKSRKNLFLSFVVVGLLIGCGGIDDTKEIKVARGTLLDDVVYGAKYINGKNVGYTDKNRQFPYKSGKIEFFLQNIKLDELENLIQVQ